MDWFKAGKGVRQGCTVSSCLLTCTVHQAWLGDSQDSIKHAGRNINNLRYADDTTQMAESKEDLKSLLMRVKGETKHAGLKPRSWHLTPSLHSKQMGKVETVAACVSLNSQTTVDGDCSHETRRHLLPGRKAMADVG